MTFLAWVIGLAVGRGVLAVYGFAPEVQPNDVSTPSPEATAQGEAQPDPQPEPPASAFDDRLAVIDRAMAKVADLRADFRQEKHTPLLRRPMVSTGTVVVRGDRARWDTREPRPSIMTLAVGEVRIYYPEARIVEIYVAEGEMREMAGSPLPRLADLRERFTIREIPLLEVDPRADAAMLAARLEPRSAALREHIEFIRVLIDPATPCIRILEIVDPDGERTRVELTNVRTNTGVKDGDLGLSLPAGVREVRPGGDGR